MNIYKKIKVVKFSFNKIFILKHVANKKIFDLRQKNFIYKNIFLIEKE